MGNLISISETKITSPPATIETIENVINMQNILIPKLQQAIDTSSKLLVIEAYTQPKQTTQPSSKNNPIQTAQNKNNKIKSTEQFTNIENVSENIVKPQYFPKSNTPIIKDYIDAYNTSLALIDDPNQLNKVKFDAFIYIQNKKLDELQQTINSFPTNGNIIPPIKSIKNVHISKTLNVEYRDPNTNTNTNTTFGNGSSTYPNYLIYGNNGCLQYNKSIIKPNTSNSEQLPASWSFKSCNSNDPNQRFTMKKVNTLNEYNAEIKENNDRYKITDTNTVIMGFNVVQPETDPHQCLMLNNDGLSVMPCNMEPSQRFKQLSHSVYQ